MLQTAACLPLRATLAYGQPGQKAFIILDCLKIQWFLAARPAGQWIVSSMLLLKNGTAVRPWSGPLMSVIQPQQLPQACVTLFVLCCFARFGKRFLSSITALPIMNLFQKINKCFQLLLSFRPVRSRVVGSSSFSGPLVGCSSCCRNQFKYHVPLCQIKAPSPVPLINFPKGVTSC